MSNALVLYLSVSGTTERVAGCIAAGLRSSGWHARVERLRDDSTRELDAYDMLGIGFPAHYFRAPYPVMHYLHALPDLDGLPVFIFLSYGVDPGDAGNMVREVLARRNAWEIGYLQTRGEDHYIGYLNEGYLFSPECPDSDALRRARQFGRQCADRFLEGCSDAERFDPPASAVYRLERFLANHVLAERVYTRLFRVDFHRCTACGLCMEHCPMGNISADIDGQPIWGHHCLLCLNCELVCPEHAVHTPADWALFKPLVRFNIRRAVRDPDASYRRLG